MPKTLRLYGLTQFDLTPTALTRLGRRTVRVSVQLRGRSVSEVANLRPRQRTVAIEASLQRQLARLRRAFPELKFVSRGGRSWTVDVASRANQITALARRKEVTAVWLKAISGRRARKLRPSRVWFCVWAIVAVQIEGRRTGTATAEDRLVLVKARNTSDAERRVRRKTKGEARPYLNSDGELVRWVLVSVKDVFELFDEVIDPDGTEVYSKLRRMRMRPEFSWPSQHVTLLRAGDLRRSERVRR